MRTLKLELLEEYKMHPLEKNDYVVFGDTLIEVTEDSLIIAVYNGHGKWFVRSKTKFDWEVKYKLKRICDFAEKIVSPKKRIEEK